MERLRVISGIFVVCLLYVVAFTVTTYAGPVVVSGILNDGDSAFTYDERYTAGNMPIVIVAGDFDADGDLDPATADLDSNTATVLFNQMLIGRTWYISTSGSDETGDGSVGNPFATIQWGIDTASVGDTVLVVAGTYTGDGNRDIDFAGKSILVMSESGAEVTTIDCEGSEMETHIAFHFQSGETRQTIVDGFTITGAYVVDLWSDSGVVRCYLSSPTIRNCVITDNTCTGVRSMRNSSPRLDNCTISTNSRHGIHVANLVYPMSNLEMYQCLIRGNSQAGLYVQAGYDITVSNCTFVENGAEGIMFEGDPPKTRDYLTTVENTIVAYNSGVGISRIMWYPELVLYCNNSYGNDGGNYLGVDAYAGDTNDNFSLPPLFCDRDGGNFQIHSSSPCAPEYNDCQVLIGAYDIGCSETYCGDVNGDGFTLTVGDMVFLTRYIFGEAHPIAPWQNSDIDLCGTVNISDLALYIETFIWGLLMPFCEEIPTCYLPIGANQVTLGCPVNVTLPYPDSVALPIYITNDTALTALSLGFRYNSDDIEITSLDTTGSVLPEGWGIKLLHPTDSAYVWSVTDSNMVMIAAYLVDWAGPAPYLQPQSDGLLATLWIQIAPDVVTQTIDIDTVFFPPAGEFIFSPKWSGTIIPAYVDCGEADIVIGDYICGDADGNGLVEISDAVFLVNYVFVPGSPAPDPYESGDVDCTGVVEISDAVYLINYIFVPDSPEPCDPDGDGEPDC